MPSSYFWAMPLVWFYSLWWRSSVKGNASSGVTIFPCTGLCEKSNCHQDCTTFVTTAGLTHRRTPSVAQRITDHARHLLGVQSAGWLAIHFTVGISCERAAPLAEKNTAARHHVLRSLINPAQWTPYITSQKEWNDIHALKARFHILTSRTTLQILAVSNQPWSKSPLLNMEETEVL
jgi:hypothetical protein